MSATANRDKSPAEIEREVEDARNDLRNTLGDIRASLSPGQMLDQAIDYARTSGGGDFVRNLGRQVRDNPLPVALMGLGIGWLMTGGVQTRHRPGGVAWVDPDHHHTHVDGPLVNADGSTRQGLAGRAHAFADEAGDAAGRLADGARSVAAGLADAARSVGDGIGHAAGSLSDGVRHGAAASTRRAGEIADDAGRLAHDGRDRVAAATGSAYGAMRRRSHEAEAGLTRIAEEQPLLIGVAGLAIGALVGALLPTTRPEERAFGAAADRVKDEAGRMAREGYQAAGEAVAAVADDASGALADKGLDADAAKEAVSGLAASLRRHGREAASGHDAPPQRKDGETGSGRHADAERPRPDAVPAQAPEARPTPSPRTA